MLVEMGLLEQRHKPVLEVLNVVTVTDVARRYSVVRQTLHDWLRSYAQGGLAALRGPQLQAGHLPPPNAPRGRGTDLRPTPGAPRLGTPDHPPPPFPGEADTATQPARPPIS